MVRGGRRRGASRGTPAGDRSTARPVSSTVSRHSGLPRRLARVDVAAGLDPDAEDLVAVQHHAASADDERRGGHVDRVGVLGERTLEALDLDEEALDARPAPARRPASAPGPRRAPAEHGSGSASTRACAAHGSPVLRRVRSRSGRPAVDRRRPVARSGRRPLADRRGRSTTPAGASGSSASPATVSRPAQLAELERLAREFFAQPDDVKAEIAMVHGGAAWRGWFPLDGELTSGRPDHKEGIYFGTELGPDHPAVRAGRPLHGANLFPADPRRARPGRARLDRRDDRGRDRAAARRRPRSRPCRRTGSSVT